MSQRDSQRSKVYKAERNAGIQQSVYRKTAYGSVGNREIQPMTIEECQKMVDKILTSKYVQRKYDSSGIIRWGKSIRVVAGKSGGMARDEWGVKTISLGIWGRQEFVVIHEVAHHLAGLHNKHNWRFCQVELDLVRHFMGKEAHDSLKAEFKKLKVKFTAPRKKRELTPEQRAILVERMAKAREAKARNQSSSS